MSMPTTSPDQRPFIKICGLRGGGDVAAALEGGADAIGVLLTESPRQISWEQARAVANQIEGAALTVGVFHGETAEEVQAAVAATGITAIQLHGAYPQAEFAALADLGLPLVRAVSATAPALAVGAYGEELLIVDAPKPGSGQSWDYRPLKSRLTGRWILAGGLNPQNVRRAVQESGAWGVDVSSGVEAERGIKDPAKIAAFIAAARQK